MSVAASLQSKDPRRAATIADYTWKYLAMTWNEVVTVRPVDDTELVLEAATDASLAPGGYRSRTGVVISLNGTVIHWTSSKQSLVAVSTCESKLNHWFEACDWD